MSGVGLCGELGHRRNGGATERRGLGRPFGPFIQPPWVPQAGDGRNMGRREAPGLSRMWLCFGVDFEGLRAELRLSWSFTLGCSA